MPKIKLRDARAISKKLNATIEPGRRHEIAKVFVDGKQVSQFGIRRGKDDLGHDYIPSQLHVTRQQAVNLAKCHLTIDDWIAIQREKGMLSE